MMEFYPEEMKSCLQVMETCLRNMEAQMKAHGVAMKDMQDAWLRETNVNLERIETKMEAYPEIMEVNQE